MKKAGRLVIGALVLITLVTGGFLWWQRSNAALAPALVSAPVTRGTIEMTVLAEGTLKPRNMVAVGAQVSGRITALHVGVGQVVRQGDLIAEIDSVTQENQLRNAEAALANVQAQLAEKTAQLSRAERTLARQQQMLKTRTVAQADFETAEEAVDVARAQIKALNAQVEQAGVSIETAEANLGYTRITAPMDGTVLDVVVREGQTVNAVQSAPTIVILGQLDQMSVVAEISEADILKVQPGQPVWFTVLGDPSQRYEAVLDSIDPAPDSIVNDSSLTGSTGSSATTSTAIYYNGNFTVPNPDGKLRTYMTAEVHIVLGRAENVLTIPSAALGRQGRGGQYTVNVTGADGLSSPRQVRIGLNDKVTAEVEDGLTEGEQVVTGSAGAAAAPVTGARTTRRGPPSPMGF